MNEIDHFKVVVLCSCDRAAGMNEIDHFKIVVLCSCDMTVDRLIILKLLYFIVVIEQLMWIIYL
jgi:hypothetical protein